MNAMNSRRQQNGLSLTALLAGAVVLIFLAVAGMKIIPPYLENREIKGILQTIANDPALQEATPEDIRNSYDKRAIVNSITVVNSRDLNIDTSGSRPVITAHYQVKIPIAGNATLVLDFDTNSSAN